MLYRVPISVNLKRKDLKAELARAISSTYFTPTTGTSVSVRVATPSSTSSTQTLENILEAIPQIVALIQDGWENILSLGVKTSNSVFLPVYSAKLEGRFDGSKSEAGKADSEMDVEEQELDEPKVAERKAAVTKPKTKTKASSGAGAGSADVKEKKKSSTIGSGSAARKTKQGVVGTVKSSKKA